MFCDLVGSTALSTRFDPEDVREIDRRLSSRRLRHVARFRGFVAKYMGDGVLVYFGYPEAHEDDAERAVLAGLAVIDAVGRLGCQIRAAQARIGIATGLVVVGDLIGTGSAQERGGRRRDAEPRRPAAGAGRAPIGRYRREHTRLVGDLFEYRDLGAPS